MNNILLAFVLIAATPPAFEVQRLGGPSLVGKLVELSPDQITLEASGGRVTLETDQVLSVSANQKPSGARLAKQAVVALIDGSTVLAREYLAAGPRATIRLLDGDVIEMPTLFVRSVQLQQGSDALTAEWRRLKDMKADTDLLMIRQDETIDYHKGVLHDVTKETAAFDIDGELLPVKRSKIFGFVYRHGGEAALPPAVCQITDASGSRWSVRSLAMPGDIEWTTPAGLSVSVPVDQLVQIDFSSGKIVYLSDLTPDSVHWTPFFDAGKPLRAMERFYAPRYDRGFDSAPLKLAGIPYAKGLALHSRTRLVYRLPEHFSRFRAIAGIDDSIRPGGKVRLVIHGDDKQLLDTAIAGSDAPRPIDIDMTGIRRLTILVDFDDSLTEGDYLLLCNARLSK